MHYPVIRFEIIDLLPEDQSPQVLAQEFDHVQCVGESRSVS